MGIASELITRGWTQGDYSDPEGRRVCLLGAAVHASGRNLHRYEGPGSFHWDIDDAPGFERSREAQALCRVLLDDECDDADEPYYPYDYVPEWNDDPERTYDEVLRLAKRADELLDNNDF